MAMVGRTPALKELRTENQEPRTENYGTENL
jgi:hypothetical protein